jgi:hypothetical protein
MAAVSHLLDGRKIHPESKAAMQAAVKDRPAPSYAAVVRPEKERRADTPDVRRLVEWWSGF